MDEERPASDPAPPAKAPATGARASAAPGYPGLLMGALHAAVLWTFAIAQPLLATLSDSPDFFVARGNTQGDILILAFALILVVPLVILGVEAALSRWERVRRTVHTAVIGVLAAGVALRFIDHIASGPSAVLIGLALVAGAAFAWFYDRHAAARQGLSLLSPSPLLVLLVFLVLSPVHKLVFPQKEASAKTSVAGGTPVVLLVLDEFSGESLLDGSHHIDAARFPNLAALARSATWYRNDTTVADHTTRAVPAILSGRRPPDDALPIASDYPGSIFTLLGRDYSFANVDEPSTDVCPTSLCRNIGTSSSGRRLRDLADDLSVVSLHQLLPRNLGDRLPAVDRSFQNFRGQGRDTGGSAGGSKSIPAGAFLNRPARVNRFLAKITRPGGRPQFDFLHVQLPHTAYQYLPSGQEYAANGPEIPGINDNGVWSTDPALALVDQKRYLLQVGYVDGLVGRLIRRLKAQGIYDRAIIAITADHGISFRPGSSRRTALPQNFSDVASVPLFIKYPGERTGRIDDGYARSIDIVPTIADALHVKLPWRADGRSLLGPRPVEPVHLGVYPKSTITVPFAQFLSERAAAVAANIRRFGTGWSGVYRAGGRLLGTVPGPAARASTAPGLRAELDAPLLYTAVNPASRVLPTFVTGRLVQGGRLGQTIALSVNGRIAGTADTYQDGPDLRFQDLVPPAVLRRGRNRIDLYLISRSGAARTLRKIPRSDDQTAGLKLVTKDGKQVVSGGPGGDISVTSGVAQGFVDGVRSDGNILSVTCWAIDPRRRVPADRVLVFAGGRLVMSGPPTLPRPDVVKSVGTSAVRRSGFQLSTVTPDAAALAGKGKLVVVAVAGRRASLVAQ